MPFIKPSVTNQATKVLLWYSGVSMLNFTLITGQNDVVLCKIWHIYTLLLSSLLSCNLFTSCHLEDPILETDEYMNTWIYEQTCKILFYIDPWLRPLILTNKIVLETYDCQQPVLEALLTFFKFNICQVMALKSLFLFIYMYMHKVM